MDGEILLLDSLLRSCTSSLFEWWQTFCLAAAGAKATLAAGLRFSGFSGFSERAREMERPRETDVRVVEAEREWVLDLGAARVCSRSRREAAGVVGSDVTTSANKSHSSVR